MQSDNPPEDAPPPPFPNSAERPDPDDHLARFGAGAPNAPPDTYFETGRTDQDRNELRKPDSDERSIADEIFGADPGPTAPDRLPSNKDSDDDRGRVEPAQGRPHQGPTAPATEAERKEREERYRAAFADRSIVLAEERSLGVRSVKRHLGAAKRSGILLDVTGQALRTNLYSSDPPHNNLAAAEAINELFELFPDQAA